MLEQLAARLENENKIKNTIATETVFENGFDPLDGGFRPAEAYQVFDQWIEVLPTDQVVAVEVTYDPKTGQQDGAARLMPVQMAKPSDRNLSCEPPKVRKRQWQLGEIVRL